MESTCVCTQVAPTYARVDKVHSVCCLFYLFHLFYSFFTFYLLLALHSSVLSLFHDFPYREHKHTHTHTHSNTHTHTYAHTYTQTHTHIHTHTLKHTHTCTHTHTHTHSNTHTLKHTHTHTCTHIHTQTHTHAGKISPNDLIIRTESEISTTWSRRVHALERGADNIPIINNFPAYCPFTSKPHLRYLFQNYPSVRGKTLFRSKDRLYLTKSIIDSFFDMGILKEEGIITDLMALHDANRGDRLTVGKFVPLSVSACMYM